MGEDAGTAASEDSGGVVMGLAAHQVEQGEVEPVLVDLAQRVRVGRLGEELEVDLGMVLEEMIELGTDEILEQAEPDIELEPVRPDLVLAPFVTVEDGGGAEERLQVAGERGALGGEARALAGLAREQGHAELVLERLQMIADRRLRDAERLGGDPEAAAFAQRLEHIDLPQREGISDHQPTLSPIFRAGS